jgi:hypothetical protein
MVKIMIRKNTLKKWAVFFILLFFSLPLIAQEETGSITGVITDIEVIGLKRTKPHIAYFSLEKFLGQEGESLDISEVFAAVKDTGILEMVSAELIETEKGLLLRVTVEEKWAFFPLPMFFAGSGGMAFGLFLIDANAFGQRDQFALGSIYSSGLSGILMYNHTPNRRGLPGWNTFISYGLYENEDLDRDEKVHRRYSTDRISISLGINYNFIEYFSGSVSVSFTNISLVENDEPLNSPEDGAMVLALSPGLSLRSSSWDGFLLSNRSLSFRYGYNHALQGSSFHQVELRGVFEQSLIPGFRANFSTGAVWRSFGDTSTNILFEYTPQSVQIDILPRGFSARHFAGVSVGLEKHLIQFRYGSLSALGSWQCVFSHGPISGDQFDHGPSGGVRFILTRLALPAMGLNLAYNMNSGLFQVVFNIGMEL